MSKLPDFVQGIEMPAMKKKAGGPVDLMRPGNGTPWEDRGSTGMFVAYFKTATKSLTSPNLLMDHIRRPETTTDSRGFAIISAVMWMVGVVLYNAYWLYRVLPNSDTYAPDIVTSDYWLTVFVQCVLVGVGVFLWLTVGPKLYRSLGATELKGAQPSLISNCFNYAMGPSILAIIPVFGWILAFVWILADLIIAGKRRLYMKTSGAIVNVMILAFLGIVLTAGSFLVVHYVWGGLLDMSGLSAKPEPKKAIVGS